MTRSERIGTRWRWLFLVGAIIYFIGGIDALVSRDGPFTFLGAEMNRWPYVLSQLGLGALLFSLFLKHHRMFRQNLKDQVMAQQEKAENED